MTAVVRRRDLVPDLEDTGQAYRPAQGRRERALARASRLPAHLLPRTVIKRSTKSQ
jgi:hypothetical protein